ncbi:MAG: ATP-binding protein, partial [Actinomycetota bacterium]|nr:ATP-binding protein [Actinomycetota bacterium]
MRHEARVWKDQAGELRVQCDDTDLSEPRSGTAITAHVPLRGWSGMRYDPAHWARAFSLYNPHAKIRIRRFDGGVNQGESRTPDYKDSYLPTRDATKRFKYLPSDPTSPHWYDEDAFKRLVYSHIGHHRHDGGDDLHLRAFVRQFKGLSATSKAKAVCDYFRQIKMLSDFGEHDAHVVQMLLDAMKDHSDAPSHTTLGCIGRDHFEERFEAFYGTLVDFDYKKITGTLPTGLPYVFEFAIAELDYQEGDLFTAVNYSPTFGDPLENVRFSSAKIRAEGIDSFLDDGFAHPRYWNDDDPEGTNTAVAIHLITPAPLFLDQGKTRLEGFTDDLEGPAIGKAMFSKVKRYYTEGKRRAKGERKRERSERSRTSEGRINKAEACYQVMEEAYTYSTGDGALPTTVRDLYYAVRNRIERFGYKADDLDYGYFSQTILPAYRREQRELEKVEYEPRGLLYEPHGGKEVRLGTRSVAEYNFPDYVYNKILYSEKNGRVGILKAAGVDTRHDMALIGGQGYASEAIRTLFENAEKGEYQLFVLHDADPDGYGIARTLREETTRMPGYKVDVIDIGLKLEDALALDKRPETFTRKKKMDGAVEAALTDVEREHFLGEEKTDGNGKPYWISKRVELNDLSSPELVAYVEGKLKENDARPKVIPPDEALAERREAMFREEVGSWVDEIIAEMLSTDDLKSKMAKEFQERFKLQGARS